MSDSGLLGFLIATAAYYVGVSIRAIASPDRKSAERLARGDSPIKRDYLWGWYFWYSLVRHHGVRGYLALYLLVACVGETIVLILWRIFGGGLGIFFLVLLWPIIPILLFRYQYIKTFRLSALIQSRNQAVRI